MALIVGGSILITFTIASHEFEAPELQRRPGASIQAMEVLSQGGLQALKGWLERNKTAVPGRDLYIIGPDGADILGRHLPEIASHRLEFFNRDEFNDHRFPHPMPQIVGPNGAVYTVLLVPRRPSIFGALSLPEISIAILCIALVVSALASWWLARHFSAPIRRIQAGARALATENLDVRVSAGLEGRKDELAVLARDFDAMADQLRANRSAVTQLLRDISHELRSPLARMRVALGLARQPPADLARQLDRLEREIERLDSLISQVLKLARLHGTDTLFAREPFNLDEMVEEVVRDANFEGAAKGCTVRLEGAARALVNGNRELVRSAVENVLRNAVRYSPVDAPVEVAVERRADGGVLISIRDRGPGVPEAELERIFEPFYRVAEARDRDSGGEGIGLAITAQVMKGHGGGAKAANRPAGGFEVRLSLPIGVLAV
jgi:two-component system sensor histidine kinase CpxA